MSLARIKEKKYLLFQNKTGQKIFLTLYDLLNLQKKAGEVDRPAKWEACK